MSLAEKLSTQVDAGVRRRGHSYFLEKKVRLQDYGEDFLHALIKGTTRYNVTVDREPGRLLVNCDCPYFESGATCKHVWAVILTADAHHIIQPAPEEKSIHLVTDLENEFEPDFDEDLDELPVTRHTHHIGPWQISSRPGIPTPPGKPGWKQIISEVASSIRHGAANWPANREIQYHIDIDSTISHGSLALNVLFRQMKNNGEWGKIKVLRLTREELKGLPDPSDRHILTILSGTENSYYDYGWYQQQQLLSSDYFLPDGLRDMLLPILCATGRCFLNRQSANEQFTVRMDPGDPWLFGIEVVGDGSASQYLVRGFLKREDEKRDLKTPLLLLAGGWVFWHDSVSRLNDSGAFNWIGLLRQHGEIAVPVKDADSIPEVLYNMSALPPITLPEDLQYTEVRVSPKPRFTVTKPRHPSQIHSLLATLRFDYGETSIPETEKRRFVCLKEQRNVIVRDMDTENKARLALTDLGIKHLPYPAGSSQWEFSPRRLPEIVSALMAQGWLVEAEGRLYKNAGSFNINITSDVDWFELHAGIDFEGVTADLPVLLKALKNRENTVLLTDGSLGILPEDWLRKYGALAALGTVEGNHVRFQKNQAGLLDALLAAQPEATCDELFQKFRKELNSFDSIKPENPAAGFKGTLRAYQKDGLGWLGFLQKFGFGGCLADDMGLGKTVQVLAMLEVRRKLRAGQKNGDKDCINPSLVVVPRSLIFNWKQEAGRFTPKMRILDHTGILRKRQVPDFQNCDMILTTYGTLKRDIEYLKDIVFDYVILDEAQFIKNAQAHTAKAARLLKSRHRLAMSGTPIQNHLGELWSLFEFLNPGMLGTATVFSLTEAGGRNPPQETRDLLARALRPFILRRTKKQVAKDLPERTEETLYCELDRNQRKLYNELRDHYRASLKTKIDEEGINNSKIMVLEALLRLRQAACHPGLLDGDRVHESSAKLEALVPQISEVIEEDHKVLVFSQFTSFLSIVRRKLDSMGIRYEYLDGQTRDRESKVNTFQNDSDCRLFLISLKAGGLGLNLTAAEYVFLLDPWWNPYIEAQAIDRAHRIGQTRKVFAYRLIAKDTVEEKVLELQKTKKDLADSIINADNSLIKTLSREDLELLLG
ncbi:MAG: hypothetical protein A2283_09975 [Lentisphaerae bacterium RIFOXYA12_FULL_48_11]|nr:MAG: hypothetical protein A2283_09975 [Lentisphaerae bacterium RIFOXYA12_FULL_48_11]